MTTTIEIIWWIGLIGALPATLLILKEVALLLRELQQILKLAEFTRDAARQIARNTAVIPQLHGVVVPAANVTEALTDIGAAVAAIEQKITGLAGRKAA
jgi:hypothetical protein